METDRVSKTSSSEKKIKKKEKKTVCFDNLNQLVLDSQKLSELYFKYFRFAFCIVDTEPGIGPCKMHAAIIVAFEFA